MDDAPPVTVPTAVREPFDFGDEPFGDHDAIASVLDDAGRMLGVERDAGRASKAAPSVFDKVTRSEYAAPSAAAAAAAQKAVADELEALADGFPAEESLGVQIGTIGRSGAVAAATAAVATDAKAARRADQLKKYGRAGPRGTGASSGKNHARLPKSVYAQDLEARDRAKAEREAREAKARAPFITAKYGVKLPAPVSSLQIGEKSAKARARRAALGAAKQANAMRLRTSNANEPSPFAAVPWRVNANVAHDVTDPISVSFNEAKRARAKAELKAKEERLKRDPNGVRGARVDRSKYPSFKAWLDAQAEHDAKLRLQMPGYVDAARAANAKRREAAYMEKVRLASGVPNAPGESKLEPSDVTSNLGGDFASNSSSANAAPALNRFIALTEAFADASSSQNVSLEEQERALMECAAEAAREAVEAAAAAAADASLAEAAEKAATQIGEAAYEDDALLRQVEDVQTPKKDTTKSTPPFILGQNPRGSPRSLFVSAETFGPRDDADSKPARPPGRALALPMTDEERLAEALSKMTPEERLAARAKASKGWSGDFTGVFYAKSPTVEGEDAAVAAPTWSEKPVARGDFLERSRAKGEDSNGANDEDDVSSDAALIAAKEDKSVSKTDTDSLAVQFIGPNAAELAFRALNPDAPKEATPSAKESTETRYASPGAVAARDAAARAAEGLDPADPACPAQCVARLKEMGIEFFGKQADVLAFKAVFPDREVPKDATKSSPDETEKAKTSGKSSSFDPEIPLAHQTGAAGLAVEFIGANAEELTRRALRGDEDAEAQKGENVEKHFPEVWSSDREAEEMKSALPSTPEGTPSRDALDAVVDEFVREDVNDDSDAPLSAAQEEAWSKAAVPVPGTSTSASPAALEANLADMQTAENEVAAAEASAAAARDAAEDDVDLNAETNAAFAEADRAYEHLVIDAGSGAAVPTALVAPLSDDALRDAGTPGGGES